MLSNPFTRYPELQQQLAAQAQASLQKVFIVPPQFYPAEPLTPVHALGLDMGELTQTVPA